MSKLSKNTGLSFFIFVLAFVAYFSLWAYINHRPAIPPNWAVWRGSLVVGCLFLIGVFFFGRDNLFTLHGILIGFIVPLALMVIWLVGFAFIYWRLPQLSANDVGALFILEGVMVILGSFIGFCRYPAQH